MEQLRFASAGNLTGLTHATRDPATEAQHNSYFMNACLGYTSATSSLILRLTNQFQKLTSQFLELVD